MRDVWYHLIEGLFALFLGITWLLGFVIAKGVWSTIFCIIPFYSWYLVLDFFFNRYFS